MDDDPMAVYGATSVLINHDDEGTEPGGQQVGAVNGIGEVMEQELRSIAQKPSFSSSNGPYAICSAVLSSSSRETGGGGGGGGGGSNRRIFFGRGGQTITASSSIRRKSNMGKKSSGYT